MVVQLDAALAQYAEVIERDIGLAVKDIPGAGAAGGLGATRADNAKSRFARRSERASYGAGAARVRTAYHRLGTRDAAPRGRTRLNDARHLGMSGPKWAHRFVMAVRPVVEDSSLLFYGAD